MKEHEVSRHPTPLGEVVLICTSTVEADGGTPQGCWLPDVAQAYYVLVDAGYDVTVSSVKGGEVPLYTSGHVPEDPVVQRFLQDKVPTQCLKNSVKVSKIQAVENYDVFYLAGGTGAMVDFPNDAVLSNLLSCAFEAGKIIAACGLGVAGLLAIQSKNLAGRKVACSPDLENIGHGSGHPSGDQKALKDLLVAKGFQPVEEDVVTDVNIITARTCAFAAQLAQVVTQVAPKHSLPHPPATMS